MDEPRPRLARHSDPIRLNERPFTLAHRPKADGQLSTKCGRSAFTRHSLRACIHY